jgi:hypothetical protein
MDLRPFPRCHRYWKIFSLVGALFMFAFPPACGQAPQSSDLALEKAEIGEIIDSVLNAFKVHYVYPDTARAMDKFVRDKYKSGEYNGIKGLKELMSQLTSDLREVSGDLHIRISVMSPDDFKPGIGDTLTHDKILKRARDNFYFRKVEWLPGNVGYLRLDRFDDPSYAGQTAAAAMNFIANCDAAIIDLRYNGGGEEKMVRLLSSYFYKEPVQIGSLYFTETDSLEQSWSYAYVPGEKMIDADLYILSGQSTASGAEAFTYSMKHHKRARVIGETTAGAAHWAEYYDFPNLQVRTKIPIARPINPVTKTSWEKVGVKPHIEVPHHKALGVAYREALKKLAEKSPDEQIRRYLEWHITAAEARISPANLSADEMAQYTGVFDNGKYGIHVSNNRLFWRYADGTDYVLIPLMADLFGFDDTDDIRLRIIRGSSDDVTGFQLVYNDGREGSIKARTGDWID